MTHHNTVTPKTSETMTLAILSSSLTSLQGILYELCASGI